MRYPRLFIVWLVAFGLAASPTVFAHAENSVARPWEPGNAESAAEIVDQTVLVADPGRRSAAVGALVDATNLDGDQAGRLLDAFGEIVVTVADAGHRAGVLAIPEVFRLIAGLLRTPTIAEVSSEAADLTDPWSEVEDMTHGGEVAAIGPAGEAAEQPTVDSVERWRPLVEQYFAEDRIAEALSIIDCESNGDPNATNSRSSAAGLFQFINGTWEHASEQAGFGGVSALDPEANVAAAAWLVDYSLAAGQSAWAHWTCRP
jgi:hypothetical protein